jgi:hypothetical protein
MEPPLPDEDTQVIRDVAAATTEGQAVSADPAAAG